ncbi:DUF3168 domain-containing protein [Pectobacterium wasabiae]|uniref:DUF3168 domain-containing protein n=1 Tax=Pectobacterium wasabiae TaxID=55208 RepID=A0AAW3EN98_9GAMM|nr:DUF3168 domain-containing protein [Pectobacterium wasabiae]AOR64862.1 hypothetical protein A7983_16690 [Pectobacterium wasabiae CFBP 3304]EJS96285.1 Putative structural component of cryptic prophage [Pectobacterium wasabiae CFBP 3304]KFX09871.1 hypothetical protein JV38_02815 [Pectobacterium wasabiae]KGA30073.1 hypothetical protein KU73_06540 [Pectobacterium wasabiae]
MTETDIYPLISDLSGGNVYPYIIPLNAEGEPAISPPWVVFSFVSQPSADVLCGPAETTSSVQFDVYAKTIAQAREICAEVIAALSPLAPGNQMLTQGHDTESSLYRCTAELQFID